jgi:hypothetical protein
MASAFGGDRICFVNIWFCLHISRAWHGGYQILDDINAASDPCGPR